MARNCKGVFNNSLKNDNTGQDQEPGIRNSSGVYEMLNIILQPDEIIYLSNYWRPN
jgi:hypothetical protein